MTEGTLGYDVYLRRVVTKETSDVYLFHEKTLPLRDNEFVKPTFHALDRHLSTPETSTLCTLYHPCSGTRALEADHAARVTAVAGRCV